MRLFEKAFKLPFALDIWGNYVWDDTGQMVLQFNEDKTGWSDIDKQQHVVDVLNGDLPAPISIGDITYDSQISCILEDTHNWIDIRGWGYLTGTGGLNLPDEEAEAIQDDLANYIIEKLTKNTP